MVKLCIKPTFFNNSKSRLQHLSSHFYPVLFSPRTLKSTDWGSSEGPTIYVFKSCTTTTTYWAVSTQEWSCWRKEHEVCPALHSGSSIKFFQLSIRIRVPAVNTPPPELTRANHNESGLDIPRHFDIQTNTAHHMQNEPLYWSILKHNSSTINRQAWRTIKNTCMQEKKSKL